MTTMKQTNETRQNAMEMRNLLVPIRDEQEWYKREKAVALSEAYGKWLQLRSNQQEDAEAIKEAEGNMNYAYGEYIRYAETISTLENSLILLNSIDCFIEDAAKTIDTSSGSVL